LHFYNNPGRVCRILCSQLRLLTVHTKDMLWVLSTQVQKHTNRGEIKFLSNINSQQALVPFALCCYSVPLFFAQRYERYGSRTFQEMTRDTHTHTNAVSFHTNSRRMHKVLANVLQWSINLTYPCDGGPPARTRTRLEKCN